MSGGVLEHLAKVLESASEVEREALLALLERPKLVSQPVIKAPARPLPPARTAPVIEWV
ncbi:hypothetical protein HUN43_00048 [Streptomyces phage Endor1]|uniref:Uncharacterized protein n=1 Tax=Streptomyces phage Endor1 TaxID=2740181 RepID=A0A7G4AWY4_9CAUD|nr:hypothetical protein KGG92_gp48 [Streptomyces phage Endor1]QMP84524.1 hypothetical protein HUN43_00048 [Streptomyces phage Endor1]